MSVPLASPLLADDNEILERFLSRLGLVDLQTLQLEQTLESLPAGDARRHSAERLADLYAGQLIEKSEDKPAYDAVLQRIQRLVQKVPEAKTAALEVMLLQADYFRAETLMTKWMSDRTESAARDEAAAILGRIAPQLDARQQELNTAAEKSAAEIDAAKTADEQELKTREWNRLQSVAGRASFFAAWARYYLALSHSDATTSQAGFARARDLFRRILGLEGNYAEVQPDGLGLESIWRSRSLIGLAMAEIASGNPNGGNDCFQLLERGPAPAEIHEFLPYWRLTALLNARLLAEAVTLSDSYVRTLSGLASQGRVSFCVTLVQAGYAGQPADQERARELGQLGVTGLIKLRQQNALKQLVDKYHIPLEQQVGFYPLWFHGQQQLNAAEASKRDEDYRAAVDSLSSALSSPDAANDLGAAAQCRYQLAWCQYRLNQLEAAAKNYEQARDALKPTDAKTAIDAAWMAFVSYQTLARTERRFVAAALNVLAGLKRDFPEHPYAKRADYYIGKLQQAALSTAETITNLERVLPNAPDYLNSRFEICTLRYEQWKQAMGDSRRAAASQLVESVSQYLAAAQRDSDASRKLRVCLLAVEAAVGAEPPDETTAARFLDAARRWTEERQNPDVLAEFHYRSLQLAARHADDAARNEHAEWIVKHAPGSAYELPSLVIVAKSLDESLSASRPAPEDKLQEALRVYQRLAQQLGDVPDNLRSKKNAQVAVSRLADIAFRLGRYDMASDYLARLLEAFPAEPGYLRRAGLADFEAKRYQHSIERWRLLALGLPRESEAWFEAKYYQLACLARLDNVKARDALAQFQLLYPQGGPPAWRARFAELQEQLAP